MATLVSPGVSVTITDESFFIPASAPTVPLIFIATAEQKLRPDGVTIAEGTVEHDVIRTVTSLQQSTNLYGIPRFLEDSSGAQHHGDARNEYGVFGLNQFMGVGNFAYVLRTNINLNDDLDDLRTLWDSKMASSQILLENLVNEFINEFNLANGYTPATPGTAGYQDVDMGGLAAGTNVAYATAAPAGGNVMLGSVVIDGGASIPLSFTIVNSSSDTYNDVLNAINVSLAGAGIASIVGGNIRITSASTGVLSSVVMTDGTSPLALFADMETFASIFPGVVGTASPFKITVSESEFLSLADESLVDLFSCASFISSETTYKDDHTALPLDVFANGFTQPSTGTFLGLTGDAAAWSLPPGLGTSANPTEWNAIEAGLSIVSAGDQYKYTNEFFNLTSLGANDAARRVAIATAFQASINSNTELRSDTFEYNLVLTPGWPEVVDEMLALVVDIQEEALVIGDTPNNLTPDGVTNPATGWSVTTARQNSINVAYYYPSVFASNLDGVNVLAAASGTALRTYGINDDTAFLWWAPAGLRRGLITGISDLGYADGQLGGPTEFVAVNINQGQQDALYQDTPSGRINPLVFKPGQGFVVWGQKTSAPQPSAMDRVSVSRMMKYIKRSLRKNTLSFVFEPNDQLTRDNLKAVVDSFLGDLIVKRGLFDFATISDDSNNTPDRIDRNEMYIDVAVKPTKAAEFIYIPIRIVSTGAEI